MTPDRSSVSASTAPSRISDNCRDHLPSHDPRVVRIPDRASKLGGILACTGLQYSWTAQSHIPHAGWSGPDVIGMELRGRSANTPTGGRVQHQRALQGIWGRVRTYVRGYVQEWTTASDSSTDIRWCREHDRWLGLGWQMIWDRRDSPRRSASSDSAGQVSRVVPVWKAGRVCLYCTVLYCTAVRSFTTVTPVVHCVCCVCHLCPSSSSLHQSSLSLPDFPPLSLVAHCIVFASPTMLNLLSSSSSAAVKGWLQTRAISRPVRRLRAPTCRSSSSGPACPSTRAPTQLT